MTSAIEQARLKHFMVHKEACRPSKSVSEVHDQSMMSDPGTDSSMVVRTMQRLLECQSQYLNLHVTSQMRG